MRFPSIFAALALVVALSSAAPAHHSPLGPPRFTVTGSISAPAARTTLPLLRRGNHLYVDAQANGQPVRLLVDNGATLNIFTPDAAKRLGLADTFNVKIQGAKTLESRGTIVDTMTFGAATLKGAPAFINPLPEEADCDGVVGAALFRTFTVTLDYEHKTLTLAKPMAKFTVPGAVSLPLQIKDGLALVEATVDGIRGRFQTDTGNQSSLILFKPWVEKHALRSKFTPNIRTITGQGLGGFLRGSLTRIPSLTVGNGKSAFTLSHLDGELSDQTEGGFYSKTLAGNLGGEVLSRFTVTFDYANRRLFLQPNVSIAAPFIVNRSGLMLNYIRRPDGVRVFQVTAVLPGSPASEAGVAVGDTILSVNGENVDRQGPQPTRDTLRQPSGTMVQLELQPANGNATKSVMLTLRDLL